MKEGEDDTKYWERLILEILLATTTNKLVGRWNEDALFPFLFLLFLFTDAGVRNDLFIIDSFN